MILVSKEQALNENNKTYIDLKGIEKPYEVSGNIVTIENNIVVMESVVGKNIEIIPLHMITEIRNFKGDE